MVEKEGEERCMPCAAAFCRIYRRQRRVCGAAFVHNAIPSHERRRRAGAAKYRSRCDGAIVASTPAL